MEIIKNEGAQFMLLAGFIIAIGLVIMSALLSNIIFQGNMAGEAGADPLKYEIVNLMQITGDEMKSAYRNATNSSAPKSILIANFTNQTRNFNANLSRIYALRGEGVKVSNDTSNWNNYRYANYTKNGMPGGEINWTVMESVKNVSVFELRNISGNDNEIKNFKINVTNQTTGAFLWSMELEDGEKKIRIKNQSSWPGEITGSPFNLDPVKYDYINLLNPSYYFNASVGSNTSKISFYHTNNLVYGRFKILGSTTYGRNFTRARDYILYSTVTLSTSRMRVNITIPVSVPW